jgi:hypothetical protein
VLAIIVPVSMWAIYATVRSTWVPIENHDAISYHMPRAVLFLLDHGYRLHRDIADGRLAKWPADYEILMANILVLGQSDQGTVLIGLFSYLGLSAVAASLCTRWWGRSHAALVAFALAASTPLAILHSGAHKNDLLFALSAAVAVYWLVPWALEGQLSDALFGVTALGLAVGTKVHGVFLVMCATPLLLAGALRVSSWRRLVPMVAYGAVVAMLLGGCVFVLNLVETGSVGMVVRTFQDSTGPLFGDWGNLWKFPFVMLLAPFGSSTALWVPWCSERYWWNQYNLYQSHFGAAFSLAVVAVAIVECKGIQRERSLERWLSIGVITGTFAAVLPLRVRPFGFFFEEARYYLALVPFVVAWACGGAWQLLDRRPLSGLPLTATALGFSGAWLVWNYLGCGEYDTFQPLAFVIAAATAPKPLRSPPLQLFHRRIGYLVDELAAERDVVAVDLGHDTWVYPMFGRDFQRPVRFLAPSVGPVLIPPDVRWVAIDRGQQEFFFTNPAMVDLRLSLVRQYFGKGTPAPNNFKILHQLAQDPAFELVYYNPNFNQALFHRKL